MGLSDFKSSALLRDLWNITADRYESIFFIFKDL